MSNCSDSNSANVLPNQYDVVLMITSLHEMYLQYLTKGTAFQDKNIHDKINVTNVNKLKLVSETISGLSKEISGLSKEGRIAVLDVGCGKVPYQKEAIDIFSNIDIKFYCIDNDENAFPEGLPKNKAKGPTFIFQKADFLTNEIGCDIPNKTNFLNSVFNKVSRLLKDNGCFVLIEFYYPKWIDHSQAKDTLNFLRKEVKHADSQVLFFTPEQYCFTAKKCDFRIKDVRIVTSSYNAETEKGNAETEKDGRLLGAYHFQKNNKAEAKTGKENISNIDDPRYSWIETNSNFAKALGKFIIEKAGSISEERLNEILLKVAKIDVELSDLQAIDFTSDQERQLIVRFIETIAPVLKNEKFDIFEGNKIVFTDEFKQFLCEPYYTQKLVDGLQVLFGDYETKAPGSGLVTVLLHPIYNQFLAEKLPAQAAELLNIIDIKII